MGYMPQTAQGVPGIYSQYVAQKRLVVSKFAQSALFGNKSISAIAMCHPIFLEAGE